MLTMFAKLMGVRMSRCHPVETFASVTVANGLIPHVPRPKPATLNSASITNAHLQDVQIAVGQLALTAIHADVTILTVQTLVPGAGTAVATIRVARRDVLSHLCTRIPCFAILTHACGVLTATDAVPKLRQELHVVVVTHVTGITVPTLAWIKAGTAWTIAALKTIASTGDIQGVGPLA